MVDGVDRGGGRGGGVEAGLIAVAAGEEQARPLLEKVGKYDTTAGLLSTDEMLDGSIYQTLQLGSGEVVGAYALQLSQHQAGSVLWVVAAAANVPGQDLSPSIFGIIEQQARQVGAAQIACTTRRGGLVKKLLGMGFEISGITLRKKL